MSFFLKNKVSSLLFYCISFKHVLLLASISEFNCLFRSRCSMEVWCPDDTGRDSWDWAGAPAWGRACFNSPEWGGGSSPVTTEPHQIVLLLLLLFRRQLGVCMITPQRSMQNAVTETNWWPVTWESRLPATPPPPSPRRRRTLHRRGLQKLNKRNLPTAEKSAKYKWLAGKNDRISV